MKIRGGMITASYGDFLQREARIRSHQLTGFLHTHVCQILKKGDPGLFFENIAQIAGIHGYKFSNLFQGDILLMFGNIGSCSIHFGGIGLLFRRSEEIVPQVLGFFQKGGKRPFVDNRFYMRLVKLLYGGGG